MTSGNASSARFRAKYYVKGTRTDVASSFEYWFIASLAPEITPSPWFPVGVELPIMVPRYANGHAIGDRTMDYSEFQAPGSTE